MNKRFVKEIQLLINNQNSKNILDNDYIIYYDESDINKVYALIKCSKDSIYRHKFIRLNISISNTYPYTPPKVEFVNHDNVRIHPTMYNNGNCCSTILNTWGDDKYEKWSSSMNIETILVTFHSFFDYHPYKHEPGGRDNESYTVYVKYQSWKTCLLRYLEKETIQIFTKFIHNYMLLYIDEIFTDLYNLSKEYKKGHYFSNCFEIGNYDINYDDIIYNLENYYNDIEQTIIPHNNAILNPNYNCNICYDTKRDKCIINLLCNHTFHNICINNHIKKTSNLCPICRNVIEFDIDDTIINPITNRKIKIGGKIWKYLTDNNII